MFERHCRVRVRTKRNGEWHGCDDRLGWGFALLPPNDAPDAAEEWGVEMWADPDGGALLVLVEEVYTCADGETRPTHDCSGHLLWREERDGFRVGTVNARSAASAPDRRECELVSAELQSAELERFRQAATGSDGVGVYSEPARWWVACERIFRRRLMDGVWEPSGNVTEFAKCRFSWCVEDKLDQQARDAFGDACTERMDEMLCDYDCDLEDALFDLRSGSEEDAEEQSCGEEADL